TKTQENSNLKAIRVDCELNTTLTKLTAVILDANAGKEWVYSTKSSVLLKQVSPSEIYYYSEISLPWPLSNRDFIAHLITKQDPLTKVVTIDGPVEPNYLPVNKGIVRVSKSFGKWIITPKGPGKVRLEYTLETDPGGSIPAWLVNMFVTKGPFETFKRLKEQLNKPKYAVVQLPFITE
ncbi:MAG: lipid-binding protein, partial [Chitinophagaceae bacterium]